MSESSFLAWQPGERTRSREKTSFEFSACQNYRKRSRKRLRTKCTGKPVACQGIAAGWCQGHLLLRMAQAGEANTHQEARLRDAPQESRITRLVGNSMRSASSARAPYACRPCSDRL
jgi:hypothetical protein